jgi:hypothetical protein
MWLGVDELPRVVTSVTPPAVLVGFNIVVVVDDAAGVDCAAHAAAARQGSC